MCTQCPHCLSALPVIFNFHARGEESGIKEVVILCQETRALCTAPFAGTFCRCRFSQEEGLHGTGASGSCHLSCIYRTLQRCRTVPSSQAMGFKQSLNWMSQAMGPGLSPGYFWAGGAKFRAVSWTSAGSCCSGDPDLGSCVGTGQGGHQLLLQRWTCWGWGLPISVPNDFHRAVCCVRPCPASPGPGWATGAP